MTCNFGEIDEDWWGGGVVGSFVVSERLRREGVEDLLLKAALEMPRHIVSIVKVCSGLATCHMQ